MSENNYLFLKGDLFATLENSRKKLTAQIGNLPAAQLLPTDDAQVCAHLIGEYSIQPIELHEEWVILIEPHEIEVERVDPTFGDRFRQKLLEFRFEIPFEGEPILFQCKPSTFNFNPPQGKVEGNKLIFTLRNAGRDQAMIKRGFDEFITSVKQFIGWQRQQLESWNSGLPGQVQQQVAARRQKLIADKQLVTDLGFRVVRRGDSSSTYALPVRQKPVVPPLPTGWPGPMVKPEPILEMAVYEEILETLAAMSVVLERNPSTFAGIEEEALRTHFLIPLNSKFQGLATGETFNGKGKTDILIKHEDRILFVAECKFWKGAQSLTDAITQLLGYLTWRETKTAILLFNRNRDFSGVLAQVPTVFAQHPQFVRQERYEKTSAFRFIVRHPSDANRHLIVTLLAFDVPTTN